jgi:hypothetical protein
MRRRLKLTIVTLVWLTSQFAMFAAPAMATCVDHDHRGGAHACCEGMEPGQVCPMHPQTASPDAGAAPRDAFPTMRCVCHASDAGLAAMLGATAILPPTFVLPFTPRISLITIADVARCLQSSPAETPPPRA